MAKGCDAHVLHSHALQITGAAQAVPAAPLQHLWTGLNKFDLFTDSIATTAHVDHGWIYTSDETPIERLTVKQLYLRGTYEKLLASMLWVTNFI